MVAHNEQAPQSASLLTTDTLESRTASQLVEMARRFVLVGLMVLAQGSMMQLILGNLISAIFLLFQVQAAPYIGMADDFLASGCSFCLVVIFLCSFAFKDAAVFGLSDIQDKMSREQQSIYVVSQGSLTLIMMASVLGAIVLSFVLFLVQLAHEGARMRRDALASKARRLRRVDDDTEVEVQAVEEGGFHIFLSRMAQEI